MMSMWPQLNVPFKAPSSIAHKRHSFHLLPMIHAINISLPRWCSTQGDVGTRTMLLFTRSPLQGSQVQVKIHIFKLKPSSWWPLEPLKRKFMADIVILTKANGCLKPYSWASTNVYFKAEKPAFPNINQWAVKSDISQPPSWHRCSWREMLV